MSEKWGDWWFKTGQTTYEEHSVEKQFGSTFQPLQDCRHVAHIT